MNDDEQTSPGAAATAELRRDLVSGNLVLVNPARSGRPTTVSPRTPARAPATSDGRGDVADCPFCSGNEASTAAELVRSGPGAPGSPGWRVRVVQNRYPVLGAADGAAAQCEVVVFRAHDRRLEDMDVDEVAEILGIICDRVAGQVRAGRAAVQVFVNAEAEAGASIAHPHAQIIGLDFTPPALDLEFDVLRRLGSDPVQRDLDRADALGLVVIGGEIPAWCPWGMTSPYAVRIAPRVRGSALVDLDAATVAAVARTLRDTLRAVNDLLDRPAYNVVVFCDQVRDTLVRRWRIEVVPRINVAGGFEIGTAVTTHTTDAASAAGSLRRQLSWLPL